MISIPSLENIIWDFRGLNTNGDYGYVVLETVEFYLHSRWQFIECFLLNISISDSITEKRTDMHGLCINMDVVQNQPLAKTRFMNKHSIVFNT